MTVNEQSDLAQECLGNSTSSNYIFEPKGRNTAPCIFLSLAHLLSDPDRNPDDVVAILPSDHIILNKRELQNTLKIAFDLSVRMKTIVTIGIKPHFPHTGFGYIKAMKPLRKIHIMSRRLRRNLILKQQHAILKVVSTFGTRECLLVRFQH